MEFQLSDKAKDYIARTKAFIQTEIEPIEAEFWQAAHKLNPYAAIGRLGNGLPNLKN